MTGCAVYRAYAADESLLYVGCTHNPVARLQAHRSRAHWYPQVSHWRFRWYPTVAEARAAETDAIKTEFPRWNVTGQDLSKVYLMYHGGCIVRQNWVGPLPHKLIAHEVRVRLVMLRQSREWLADQLGFSKSTLHRKLHGYTRWRPSELVHMARLFDIPVEQLQHGMDDDDDGDDPPIAAAS